MNFTLKHLLYICIGITHYFTYAQLITKGQVFDKETNLPLANVIIKDNHKKLVSKSSFNGSFEITEKGIYTFSKTGYFKCEIEIINKDFYIIKLSNNPSELNEIIVSTNYLPKPLKTSPASIHNISIKNLERGNSINISEAINRVPGVFMQSGALNTNRITIRGIGARNLFGTSKIRAYFQDIPLTSGSGITNIEDFELSSISNIEITKGSSSTYGAGLGGTIQLIPQNKFNKNSLKNEFLFGSFGLTKNTINTNIISNKSHYNAIYSKTQRDSYRNNNEYNRQTLTLSTKHIFNKKNELSILGSYIDLKAFIPSSLNKNDYINTPEKAAFTWNAAKGFEDVQRGLIGISWKHQFNNKLTQSTSVFSSFNNGYEPRPFNILKEKTFAFGFRTRLIGISKLFKKTWHWTMGGETFKDSYQWHTFQNLFEDFPSGHGSVKGNELSNFHEKRNYFNLFFESNHHLSPKTNLSLGLNYNRTSYNLLDQFEVSETNLDQSGNFQFKGILSPKLGLTYTLSKSISLFSNISHGFSPLSLEETLLPDGQINTNLKPETGWNYEIGSRGNLINSQLQYNISIFSLNIKNLLVARRIEEDQFIGINAGKTKHSGIELDLKYLWLKTELLKINSSIIYTYNNFFFKTFIDGENDYSGNKFTGVPNNIFNGIIDIDSTQGIYGNINFQFVDSMPITDSNSLYSKNYSLTNLKFGYKTNPLKKLNWNVYFGLNNIFNKAYASQILINASSFGGSTPRYYYPGNPINYYTGINIIYNF